MNEELVLRGEEWSDAKASPDEGEFGVGDLMGEEIESLLFIWRGDHPLADDEMMEFRTADDAALGDAWRRRR